MNKLQAILPRNLCSIANILAKAMFGKWVVFYIQCFRAVRLSLVTMASLEPNS